MAQMMEVGEIVQFLQPFKPQIYSAKEYIFGLVVAMLESTPRTQEGYIPSPEVIVRLYDPQDDSVYVDEHQTPAYFYFHAEEITPYLQT